MIQIGDKNGIKFPLALWFSRRQCSPCEWWENERDKIKKKVEESEMISNIFDDANLGNVANEPGSDITILMNLQHELMY